MRYFGTNVNELNDGAFTGGFGFADEQASLPPLPAMDEVAAMNRNFYARVEADRAAREQAKAAAAAPADDDRTPPTPPATRLPAGPCYRGVTDATTVIGTIPPASAAALLSAVERHTGRPGADVLIVADGGDVTVNPEVLNLGPSDVLDLTTIIASVNRAAAAAAAAPATPAAAAAPRVDLIVQPAGRRFRAGIAVGHRKTWAGTFLTEAEAWAAAQQMANRRRAAAVDLTPVLARSIAVERGRRPTAA
jgi:hypothetical protein